jgi:hypothetical protein
VEGRGEAFAQLQGNTGVVNADIRGAGGRTHEGWNVKRVNTTASLRILENEQER